MSDVALSFVLGIGLAAATARRAGGPPRGAHSLQRTRVHCGRAPDFAEL